MPKLFRQILFSYLIAVNVLAFVLMGVDKRRAKQNAWRIPEKTLFLPAIFGGALGAWRECACSTTRPATGISNMASPCC